MSKKKTTWIVVSGLDGSGKTTLVGNLQAWLTEKGFSVKRDRFPHDVYLNKTLLDKSKDAYTDRLLFALDNRIFGTEIREMIEHHDYDFIITQRGFLDSFVHGAVQGFSYSWIAELNHMEDLPKADIMFHMVAEAKVAYSRICNDPDADKFEYPAYIGKQERETRRAYAEIKSGSNPDLVHFSKTKNFYIDSTEMTMEEVFGLAKAKLESLNLF